MERNILQSHFDSLQAQFQSLDNPDLSKDDRLVVFRQTQETLKKIDHAVSYAKGTDTVGFGFSSILHMSTLPPLEDEQRSAYRDQMSSFFAEMFSILDQDTIEKIMAGQFEARDRAEQKAGLPQLSQNQGSDISEHEEAVYKVSDAEIQRQIDKVRKIFPRMDSEAQTEAESSYKQCFATIQKVNKMAKDSGTVGDFNIGFSKILAESDFEARLFADIKGYDLSGVPAGAEVGNVSSSTEIRVISQKGATRSLAAIATGNNGTGQKSVSASLEGGEKVPSQVSGDFGGAVNVNKPENNIAAGTKKSGLSSLFSKAAANPWAQKEEILQFNSLER